MKTPNPPQFARPANRPSRRATALRSAILGFALTCAMATGIRGDAQAIAGHNTNAPVDFAADRIELQDRQDRVVLSGNVVIDQANLRLTAARAIVNYTNRGRLQIQRMTATGGVTVTRANEAAHGDTAVYDFNRRIITMAGNVALQRSGDTLNGGRLTIDLASGLSNVDGSTTPSPVGQEPGVRRQNGRVTGSFSVPDNN